VFNYRRKWWLGTGLAGPTTVSCFPSSQAEKVSKINHFRPKISAIPTKNESLFAEKVKTEEKLNTGSQQLNANLHILAPHTAAAASTVRLAHPALMLLLILCSIPWQWNLMFLLKGHGNETGFLSFFLLALIEHSLRIWLFKINFDSRRQLTSKTGKNWLPVA
jgi:hypothetical protein